MLVRLLFCGRQNPVAKYGGNVANDLQAQTKTRIYNVLQYRSDESLLIERWNWYKQDM